MDISIFSGTIRNGNLMSNTTGGVIETLPMEENILKTQGNFRSLKGHLFPVFL